MLDEIEQDTLYMGFRLEADQATNYTGCTADDLTVSGIPWVFDGSEQGYKSGTSMATPVVAGVAGLIWSVNPGLSHHEVKGIILSSGDHLPSLTGKIVSGSRVNAYSALSITPPSSPRWLGKHMGNRSKGFNPIVHARFGQWTGYVHLWQQPWQVRHDGTCR